MSDSKSDFPPSSTDLQQTVTPSAEDVATVPPAWPPIRSIAQEPRWPHPNFLWSLLWCLLFIIVTQVPGAVLAIVIFFGLSLIAPDRFPMSALDSSSSLLKSPQMNVAMAAAMFCAETLVIGFSWLVIRLVVGREWKRHLALRRPGLAHTLLALLSFPCLVLLGNAAYTILREVLRLPGMKDFGFSGMEEMVQIFSTWPWSFAVLVIGLGPGIGEELWCRGFLGRGLVGNYGPIAGVIAASFFFGLIHVDPCQGTMAMVMGFWLHFVYLTTRSLLLPMLLHFLNNSLAVLVTRSPSLAFIETSPGDIPKFTYLAAVALLIAIGFALYQSRARLAPQSPEQLLYWRPAFEGVECPPADSGTIIVQPSPTLMSCVVTGFAFLLFLGSCFLWYFVNTITD